ncbi:E3 ubiquitin-protein ligase MPSR1-like [Populus alba x Populus x berolinensis]|nr:E3 ubiquitin-protein ligase MPSR1-like [Populus alba x Populus x berolinensis]
MASENEFPAELSSMFERLLRHRDLSLFLPFILGFTSTNTTEQRDPDQEAPQTTDTNERIILINPFTQGMVVIEGAASLESLLRDIGNKNGQPPASKASIEAMPKVEIGEDNKDGECAICLEEWELGGVVKEMPCKHRFHGGCVEKWLKIHGNCPVCRYKMPVDEEELGKKRDEGDVGRERRVEREIWVSFAFNGSRRNGDSNENPSSDSSTEDHERFLLSGLRFKLFSNFGPYTFISLFPQFDSCIPVSLPRVFGFQF